MTVRELLEALEELVERNGMYVMDLTVKVDVKSIQHNNPRRVAIRSANYEGPKVVMS